MSEKPLWMLSPEELSNHYRDRIADLEAENARLLAVVDAAREVVKNAQHEGVRRERFAREVMMSMLPRSLAALNQEASSDV